jgi:hypothetical protein
MMRFDTRTEATARAAKRRGSVLLGVAQKPIGPSHPRLLPKRSLESDLLLKVNP